ncbi:hypothetical protein TOPH_03296 [Tolypocladium ophioglossoides CBS 100239]|uniref:Xylanolytic transcriptional activator regulatory domain-containing protein n=1 Tax=Tolypocladium ophioglossoides (strain CBS 100239) TaxID=1163406 RepID=A0A0L0ND05_TOLOC|nr:hypothetical protein TOPH_03296 [Tolypocladium ophioglossoides CBS 100239]
MGGAAGDAASPAKARKRRIPSRCRALNKVCEFEELPKDAQQLEIDLLEKQVESLKAQLLSQGASAAVLASGQTDANLPLTARQDSVSAHVLGQPAALSPISSNATAPDLSSRAHLASRATGTGSPEAAFASCRKPSHYDAVAIQLPDFVDIGLLSPEQAELYFNTFFHGSDRYVPVFDPQHDTAQSVRARSSLLFSAICTVGCRALSGTDSQQWRLLNFHMKRILNAAMVVPSMASLETVQALLVRACYTSERSLLVAVATRMALDLGLSDAYDELMTRAITKGRQLADALAPDETTLMRKTRTWLYILVMGHILHVDAGDLLPLKFSGDVRRCRVLLRRPVSAKQDLCLWPQVELNALRARIYATLSDPRRVRDEDIMSDVRDAMIDLDVWYNDWARIYDKDDPQTPWLTLNLQVQRCWGVTMALCRAIRTTGVENVDVMSPTQRALLSMAKDALRQHLEIIIEEPRLYLHNLRYAMDFVWAKCVFCYLLLLKLSILLPDNEQTPTCELVACGNTLLAELSEAGGALMYGHRNNTGKLYLQLLQTGIEKYSRAMGDGLAAQPSRAPDDGNPRRLQEVEVPGAGDADSFVPEQFVFEWDFPGLTLFSSSATEAGWLDSILLEALNGTDEFMGFGWSSTEMGD